MRASVERAYLVVVLRTEVHEAGHLVLADANTDLQRHSERDGERGEQGRCVREILQTTLETTRHNLASS